MKFDDILLLQFIFEMFRRDMLKLAIGFALTFLATKKRYSGTYLRQFWLFCALSSRSATLMLIS